MAKYKGRTAGKMTRYRLVSKRIDYERELIAPVNALLSQRGYSATFKAGEGYLELIVTVDSVLDETTFNDVKGFMNTESLDRVSNN